MNGVMLQYFQWELPADGRWWKQAARQARQLRRMGFTAVWLPPAYKGTAGIQDVGYGVYDLYDLGEFDQKGTVSTKYGTREEYLEAISSLRRAGIQVLADVVFNHRLGADGTEAVTVHQDDPENRAAEDTPQIEAKVFTRFTFPGRQGRYSAFTWDHTCFTGVDWNEETHQHGLFRMAGKHWAKDVDGEKGNYDYLMGADVDVNAPLVRAELLLWGNWYVETTGCDGFRLDAVKHISASFFRDWLKALRAHTGRELFAVGEYWNPHVSALTGYLSAVESAMSLFDVPLHQHLHEISRGNGGYDLRCLFEETLVGCNPALAVTFVDNHDTQPGQSLESWVEGWFKASAYALILLRAYGYPCVFYGDLAGIPSRGIGAVTELPELMRLRMQNAHGTEHDYFDDPNVIGFTREGIPERPGSGLAAVITDAKGGEKRMFAGRAHAGRVYRCVIGGQADVQIDAEGWGVFTTAEGRLAVYVPKKRFVEWLQGYAMAFCRLLGKKD